MFSSTQIIIGLHTTNTLFKRKRLSDYAYIGSENASIKTNPKAKQHGRAAHTSKVNTFYNRLVTSKSRVWFPPTLRQ